MEVEHEPACLDRGIAVGQRSRLLGGRVEHEDAGQGAVIQERSRGDQLA